MPTLTEYILTLRTYNPGITDKTITLYLLKLGKRIEDIERAFTETNSSTNPGIVQESMVTVSPMLPVVPSVYSIPEKIKNPSTAIEVMPPELVISHAEESHAEQLHTPMVHEVNIKTETPEIHHQSFDHLARLQDMLKDLDMLPKEEHGDVHASTQLDVPLISSTDSPSEVRSGSSLQRKQFSYEELFEGARPVMHTISPSNLATPITTTSASAGTEIAVEDVPIPLIPKAERHMVSVDAITPVAQIVPLASKAEPVVEYTQSSTAQILESSIYPNSRQDAVSNTSIDGKNQPYITSSTSSTAVPDTSTVSVRKMGKKIALGLAIVGILAAGVFGYTQYVHGIYIGAKPPYTSDAFSLQFARHLASIDTAEYKATLALMADIPDPKDEVFIGAGIGDVGQSDINQMNLVPSTTTTSSIVSNATSSDNSMKRLEHILPVGSKVAIEIDGVYRKNASSFENIFSLKGLYKDDTVTLNADIESRIHDGIGYIKINDFPSFLLDLTYVKGKWISLVPEDWAILFGDAPSFAFLSMNKKKSHLKDMSLFESRHMSKVLEYIARGGVISVAGEPRKIITATKETQYVYTIIINRNRLLSLIETLPQFIRTEFGEKESEQYMAQVQSLVQTCTSPEFIQYIDYINRNSNTVVTVTNTGALISIESTSTIATIDPTTQQPGKVRSFAKLDVKSINKHIKSFAPQKVDMNSIDAYASLTGRHISDILFSAQVKKIISIDKAIAQYSGALHHVPHTLHDIASVYTGNMKDMFTNPIREFMYTSATSSEYELVYNMTLPQVPLDYYRVLSDLTIGPDAMFSTDEDTKYNTGIVSTNKKPMLTLRFVEGKNTATEKVVSKEASATLGTDMDKDGLSDVLEEYLGLNHTKADTDRDGKSDMIELRQGTNPKGAGNWATGYSIIDTSKVVEE